MVHHEKCFYYLKYFYIFSILKYMFDKQLHSEGYFVFRNGTSSFLLNLIRYTVSLPHTSIVFNLGTYNYAKRN